MPEMPEMPEPTLFFMRHGETDWNSEGRLQGQRDIPLNGRGRDQAVHCGVVMRDLLAREGRRPEEFDFIASPLSRARETMERLRSGLGLDPAAYRLDGRLAELSFGAWEGFTYAELRQRPSGPRQLAERERDKWNFLPPAGESYAQLLVRVRDWYAGLARDSIVVSHGGVARTLFVLIGVLRPDVAPVHDVDQGAVYLLAPGRLSKYT
jgi:probable phosphoglycerate mutase